ncbi:E3 SUMO-protein ligase ZNF451 isoform X2 [Scomber japonicus]|uniref:E3 SUMO-protein ligase ZNF451 isoform X2 n=1 Tax=Scomber japonicus TaxID=13676 RepID=UPI002305879F|nr:E3 SUMO-protein ligase ZNF451 isoform X2 [Scomber japonicus]
MSSPVQADEDEVEEEVEFVSMEDKIDRHKAHVTSTLDRLAQQVAQEKRAREDKCRAFKEKQILQKAHGQQELAFSSTNGSHQEAKRCVDMWLKMPGLKPGVISAGSGRRHRPASFPTNTSTKHTCPVINCGRVYDHASLLDGHLKRFDHSPCDPTINLKGTPSDLFACEACGQCFLTKEAWRQHLESKVSSSNAGGHSISQTYQRIACFACPACYLLFNLRDECLQHMSAKNHFTESLAMNEPRGRALPVPIPQRAKNRLIALCKDTTFNVRCSLCHKVLTSHQTAQAHFNVHCRQGCAVAKADKPIVQVMKQLQVRGQCSLCCKIFLSQAEMERHKESTHHDVEVNQTMARALLQYCRFSEIQNTQRARDKRQSTGPDSPFQKRNKKRSDFEEISAKRQRLGVNGSTSRNTVTAWFCECGLQFSEEATASKHLLAVNQIFHQCGVCGKLMGESSITRLHMSRFHGGAHLSNFLFYCRKCKVEMPRYKDILSHVSEVHSGHTFFSEQEVSEELTTVIDDKPSTSSGVTPHSSSKTKVQPDTVEAYSSTAAQTWMCRMCEDIFDSEAVVQKHCNDVGSHSFQRFICGHCPQKFFKESTVRRHCMNEHDGQIKSSHFCGLCDSMQFESEGEFLEHYKSLHSKDYYCMDDAEVVQPAVAESTSQPPATCPCMASEKSKEEMKAMYTQCMRNLAADGRCQYVCVPCSVSVLSYAQMKTHVHTKHPALKLDKTFDVECKTCQESFTDVPSFHKHYHSQHCSMEPCTSSRKDVKAEPTAVKIVDAVEIKPQTKEIEDETLVKFLKMEQTEEDIKANENESSEEMDHAMAVSAEEAELEEALKRSLLEF